MKNHKKVLLGTTGILAAAALNGLLSTAAIAESIPGSNGNTQIQVALAGTQGANGIYDTAGKHDCKGQNSCKGKGGCDSGDHGCKGKNSCKGKGGCNTNKPKGE